MSATNRYGRPVEYPVEYLDPNPYQPRLQIDPADLADLTESIKRFGFYGSLQARPNPDRPGDRVQVVFGHRRLAAVRAAELRTIPVVIVERTDQEMADQAFIENRTHKQLKPWEEALFFRAYQTQHGCSIRDLRDNLRVSKGYIQNRLDLLRIPEDSPVRPPLERGELDMTTAMTLHGLSLERSAGEIATLVGQVLAGTTSNSDLTRRKRRLGAAPARSTDMATAAAPDERMVTTAPAPTADRSHRPAGEAITAPRPNRVADLTLGGDTDEALPVPRPGTVQISPCGLDDEARIEAGMLHADGTELELLPAGTRAAYRLVHHLGTSIPPAED